MKVTVTEARRNLRRCLAAAEQESVVIVAADGKRYQLRAVSGPPELLPYSAAEVDASLDRHTVRQLNRAAKASR